MKPDLYTKAVLTFIMLALVMIACNQYIHPPATAEAQGPFAGVQFTGVVGGNFNVIDARTGEMWGYTTIQQGSKWVMQLSQSGKLTKLGADIPLVDR